MTKIVWLLSLYLAYTYSLNVLANANGKTVSLMNDVAITEYVLPLLHPFYVFLVIAFYLYRFLFALELSKILKYKPEQPYH